MHSKHLTPMLRMPITLSITEAIVLEIKGLLQKIHLPMPLGYTVSMSGKIGNFFLQEAFVQS